MVFHESNFDDQRKPSRCRCACQNISANEFPHDEIFSFANLGLMLISLRRDERKIVSRAVKMLRKIESDNWEITISYSIIIKLRLLFSHNSWVNSWRCDRESMSVEIKCTVFGWKGVNCIGHHQKVLGYACWFQLFMLPMIHHGIKFIWNWNPICWIQMKWSFIAVFQCWILILLRFLL